MVDVLKELLEGYDQVPFWIYPIIVFGAVSFFPLVSLLLIVLGA